MDVQQVTQKGDGRFNAKKCGKKGGGVEAWAYLLHSGAMFLLLQVGFGPISG